jgi:hypothetical protein
MRGQSTRLWYWYHLNFDVEVRPFIHHYSGLAFLGNIEGWPLGAIDLFICCEWIWKRHNNKGSSQCQKMTFTRLLQCKDSLGGSWRFEILYNLRYG